MGGLTRKSKETLKEDASKSTEKGITEYENKLCEVRNDLKRWIVL